jgi:hypothetical protein
MLTLSRRRSVSTVSLLAATPHLWDISMSRFLPFSFVMNHMDITGITIEFQIIVFLYLKLVDFRGLSLLLNVSILAEERVQAPC